MPVNKQHKEFYAVDFGGEGWENIPGYPDGIQQKILTGALDEDKKQGSRTRLLLRFSASIDPQSHNNHNKHQNESEENFPGIH